ncbi:hypothetical protein SFMTTN_2141 [Sulfuriferula multivorans]|uniref:Uncharacterized protein n=1 Tax=Sulfuriferula multivorans TaxID=1559896 RepID=A0A401JFE4_9PROT|nr:hypothetical protein SFMTTN_2141 [Sulfuriferula multivorans]
MSGIFADRYQGNTLQCKLHRHFLLPIIWQLSYETGKPFSL